MPALWKRVFLLPFSPTQWWEARSWPLGSVLAPLLLLTTVLGLSLGLYRGVGFLRFWADAAAAYDASWDPIVIDDGVLSVEGPRRPSWREADMAFVVDPDETEPVESLPERFIVARRTFILDNQLGRQRKTELKGLQDMIGAPHVRIDGATMSAALTVWSTRLVLGVALFITAFDLLGELCTCLPYALLAGLVLVNLRGRQLGFNLAQATNLSLSVLMLKPVVSTALSLAGTGLGFCWGLVVWPAATIALGYFALSRVPPPPQPGTPF